jgi:hypothetical protein
MTNLLTLPTALPTALPGGTTHPRAIRPAITRRADYHAELSIAATRFEFAVGAGAMIGGLVGLGIGAAGGGIAAAAPASAIGAVVGGAALGIPVGIYSLIQLNNAAVQIAA